MNAGLTRRDLLKVSVGTLAVAATWGLPLLRPAHAASFETPTVDKLGIRVLVDSRFDLFFRPTQVNGVTIQRAPPISDFRRTLHTEWGLSRGWNPPARMKSAP